MNARKVSIISILTVVLLFIISLMMYDKARAGVAKVIDLSLALSLMAFCYSYLPLDKNKPPYIKVSIVVSLVCIVLLILVIAGVDFSLGESVKKK